MIDNINFVNALMSLRPKAKWTSKGNDITWLDTKQIQPTQEEIDAEVVRLQTEYDALDYQRKRKAEYPSIEELVVALYDTEDKLALENKRDAIKAKYPK